MMMTRVKKLHADAIVPTRAHPLDAGLDLYALHDVSIRPGERVVIPTGIAMSIHPGFFGMIADRSSMAKRGFKCAAGIIDSGYTGEIGVAIFNLSGEHSCFRKGERVAQLLILPLVLPVLTEVTGLEDTARGENGWGSTGT